MLSLQCGARLREIRIPRFIGKVFCIVAVVYLVLLLQGSKDGLDYVIGSLLYMFFLFIFFGFFDSVIFLWLASRPQRKEEDEEE